MRILAKIFTIVISGALFSSCFESPDCINLRNDFVGFTFKKLYDGKIDTVGVLGISVSETDSIFYEFLNVTGSIHIPLNVATSSQSFTFNLLRGSFPLVVNYNSQAQFESVDCGPRYILSNLNASQHNFDSVRVTNTTPLTGLEGSNIEILRCPTTNSVKVAFRQLLADDNTNGIEREEKLYGASVGYLPFVFYPNSELGTVILPLNTAAGSTNITIDTKDNGVSVLNLNYTLNPKKLFEVCGVQDFISNIQISGISNYDIARVHNDSITDPPVTNVLLLRCPQTNMIELRLKSSAGSEDTQFQINKVTTSYTTDLFFENSLTSSLVLPLDENQDNTDFVIEFETGPKQISFGYNRAVETFHGQCNQTLFSSLQILSSELTTAPVVKNDSVQFPTVVNFEIIND